ncbi:MAG: NAD+ synthase [Deltaproteobacteria bacterium]|nr:NAD+ synthase [Deltaproteobacteria bacterium]MBW2076858.1 NAD+ synthase [Deltaproteobacteria bacterium]MBW2311476.1 NAD+ synthase [Deltaproteobacteria bacterium]RLB30880.1 MAG: NAD+ synthase [Deltaproteobacteria bacterium]
MKIALAQLNPIIGDFAYNTGKIKAAAEQAKAQSCDLVVFSELVISGYPPRDLLEKREFVEENLTYLQDLVKSIAGIGVICGYVDRNPRKAGNPLYNAAALFEGGEILYTAHKRLLPTYDVFDETRYFEPGSDCTPYPYKNCRIGLAVCEDIWNDREFFMKQRYPIDPVERMVNEGAELIINVAASPYYVGKREFKRDMFLNIVTKYGVPLVYVNQVGGNDSVLFDGISLAYSSKGDLIARAHDFEEDMVFYDTTSQEGEVHPISESDTESMLNALVMGTRDYIYKCGFSSAVVGLSGGIDSALTAYVAVQALGGDNVLLVFMPSLYTNKENFEDTKTLATNLGAELTTIPIDAEFGTFLKDLSPLFKDVETEVTGQNIQARIRGTMLMAISNKLGHLLLSTGNKSELAVGYCTLYGDMNGGLAVLSDVPKASVYRIARFINRDREIIPERIITKPPSAELKPDQRDQDDLPPYEILDDVLTAYIEDNKAPDEIVATGFEPSVVRDIITRVDRNEFKRQQSPPGLKVTTKSFGYGRRYPIAQRYQSP